MKKSRDVRGEKQLEDREAPAGRFREADADTDISVDKGWPSRRYRRTGKSSRFLISSIERALESVSDMTEFERQTIAKIFENMRAVGDRDRKAVPDFFYHRAIRALEYFFEQVAFPDPDQESMQSMRWIGISSETIDILADSDWEVTSVDQLCSMTREEVLGIDRIGLTRLAEIENALKSAGRSFFSDKK